MPKIARNWGVCGEFPCFAARNGLYYKIRGQAPSVGISGVFRAIPPADRIPAYDRREVFLFIIISVKRRRRANDSRPDNPANKRTGRYGPVLFRSKFGCQRAPFAGGPHMRSPGGAQRGSALPIPPRRPPLRRAHAWAAASPRRRSARAGSSCTCCIRR